MFVEKSVYFTSLGCSKNLVDSQVMLGHLGLGGFNISTEPEKAEVIVVNTCSFIEAAKMESIEMILDLADYKKNENGKCKALVMSGCLAQRYPAELEKELPEVDLFIGTGEYNKIAILLKALEEGRLEKKSFVEIPKYIHTEFDPRLNTSPHYMAWLKVSEGCNRNCTFCIIPTLRGKLRSRTVSSLIEEAKKLAKDGVKELNLISQDLSNYGVDLDDKNKLINLLDGLEKVEGIEWIRLFYYYPDDLSDEVIAKIKSSNKICHYLDMPVQHFSSSILKKMNRKIETKEMLDKIKRLKNEIPDIVLRTSVIVGFPGESEEDFATLLQGIEEIQFDHLGVFKYSDEDGTPAIKLKDKINEAIIQKRFDTVYKLQERIVKNNNKKYIGKTVKVLVEGAHPETSMLLVGRHYGQAPEIDGSVIINDGLAKPGDYINVKISEVTGYDLVGSIV